MLRRGSSRFIASSARAIAQPAHHTHPHLVQAGHVTRGVSADEYAKRRRSLAATLPSGTLALFPAAAIPYMSHDVPFSPYHQSADLFYLCGLLEPESLLVCRTPTSQSPAEARWSLFVMPDEPEKALWDGHRAGIDGAQRHFLPGGEVLPLSMAPRALAALLDEGGPVKSLLYDAHAHNSGLGELLSPVVAACDERRAGRLNPAHHAQKLRRQKSSAEVELMSRAAHVSACAHRATMCLSREVASLPAPAPTEAVLGARFQYECVKGGAERLAYPSVVAGGANATTLHYMHNNAPILPGDLVLMDAGASYGGYSADITRTWPTSGKYSPAQRDVYAAVLEVNRACIDACRVGRSPAELHGLSVKLTLEALVQLGVLPSVDTRYNPNVSRYYPHSIGHHLGIDVHDCPDLAHSEPLAAGAVFTIEPGLYFRPDDESVPKGLRGIGVRIEDDILVEGDGPRVLTSHVPKDIDEVELMLAESHSSNESIVAQY